MKNFDFLVVDFVFQSVMVIIIKVKIIIDLDDDKFNVKGHRSPTKANIIQKSEYFFWIFFLKVIFCFLLFQSKKKRFRPTDHHDDHQSNYKTNHIIIWPHPSHKKNKIRTENLFKFSINEKKAKKQNVKFVFFWLVGWQATVDHHYHQWMINVKIACHQSIHRFNVYRLISLFHIQ